MPISQYKIQSRHCFLEEVSQSSKISVLFTSARWYFGGQGETQELVRKVPPGYATLAMPKEPLVESPRAEPPRTTDDV